MLKRLAASELPACQPFVDAFPADSPFADPHFCSDPDNLWHAPNKRDQSVWGAFHQGRMTGLFVFLTIEQERYAEMIIGLSRDAGAYEEMLRHIQTQYRGYMVDFVLNPRNHLLISALRALGAAFEPVQKTMQWMTQVPVSGTEVIRCYDERFRAQYTSMHTTDVYWTAGKVLAAADRFRVLLAVRDDEVVGYLDITHCYDVNEPYDMHIKPEASGMGYERALLAKAIELNHPKGMTVVVDADDTDAMALYASVGFEVMANRDSVTAQCVLP